MSVGYEFTEEQNATLNSLSRKMSGVGGFLLIVGLINFLAALLFLGKQYEDRLPAEYLEKVPAEAREKLAEIKLPTQNEPWVLALAAFSTAMFYLCLGTWIQRASKSFRKIARTEGGDIPYLMHGMNSLLKLFSLIYSLLLIVIVLYLAGVGYLLYERFGDLPAS